MGEVLTPATAEEGEYSEEEKNIKKLKARTDMRRK